MIINMTGGGGGAALNFKVVPGLTQPGTAAENTIWVKTERIGAWYFSTTQPENMQEWDVWFQTGAESDFAFNALRKSGLQVYPQMAMQYVDGNLVSVETMIYQGGEWVQWWNGELYYSGNEFEDITGGWIADTRAYTNNNGVAPIITRGNTRITAKHDTNQKTGTFRTSKAVDLTGVKTIKAVGEFYNATGSDGNVSLNVWTDIGNSYQDYRVATVQVPSMTKQEEITVDVSNLQSGSYYVGFIIYSGASTSPSGADTFVGMDSCVLLK
jgi:hypothetical protein